MNYNDIDLNSLKIFVTVAECKSFLGASKKLFITQPAITTSIKKLEKMLGGNLFVRTSKGIKLTAEGELFYSHTKAALNKIDVGLDVFSNYATLEAGELKIGSSSTIIRYMLIPFISYFSEKYPKIKISIFDGLSDELIQKLNHGEVDLSIVNTPIEGQENFNSVLISKTKDCFIAGNQFSHLKNKTLDKSELSNYPLLLQKRPSSNRDFFEKMCGINNVVLSPKFEIGSFGLITDFTEAGNGIAYTIKNFVEKDIKNGRVFEVETNFEIQERGVVALTCKQSINSFACDKFIAEMQNYFKS